MGIAISESMYKVIETTSRKLDVMLKSIVATIGTDLEIAVRSHSMSLVARDEVKQERIRDFADEVKNLREKHQALLQEIESI
jgi:hypothetical protein